MNISSIYRALGFHKRASELDRGNADVEHAVRENAKVFAEMHEAYSKVPESNKKLRESIRSSSAPFVELERMMRRAGDHRS